MEPAAPGLTPWLGGLRSAVQAVLAGEHPSLGQSARLAMERRYPWEVTLRRLDTLLPTRARVAA